MEDPSSDPLSHAATYIAACGDTAETRALRRIVTAIASRHESLRDTGGIWLLGAQASRLVIALIEARLHHRYADAEWHQRLAHFTPARGLR